MHILTGFRVLPNDQAMRAASTQLAVHASGRPLGSSAKRCSCAWLQGVGIEGIVDHGYDGSSCFHPHVTLDHIVLRST